MNAVPTPAAPAADAAFSTKACAAAFLQFPLGIFAAPLGGVPVGIMPPRDGNPAYLLIVAQGDAGEVTAEWGSSGKNEPGAASEHDGLANTAALVASEHDHPAAQQIAALNLKGFNDWYLPARDESALCYAIARHLFSQDCWHWTSTQYSAHIAWLQYFGLGNQYSHVKDYKGRARAVRREILQ